MADVKTTIAALPIIAVLVFAYSNANAQTTTPPASPPPPITPAIQTPSTTPVETVVVTARANTENTKIDRTTYDVRTNPDAPVLPAIDVIAKLPGVFVGPNNRISIAGGAYVTILVDGRPMLRDAAMQIPAERIASIEVTSNPSAEFASSSQAIINIVLKKTSAATKASGSLGISRDTLDNTGLNMSLDRRLGDWGLSLSARFDDRGSTYNTSGEFNYIGLLPNGVSQIATTGNSVSSSEQVSGFARMTRDFSEFNDIELAASYYRQTSEWRNVSREARNTENSIAITNATSLSMFDITYLYTNASFTSEKEKNYKFETNLSFTRSDFSEDNAILRANLAQEQIDSNVENGINFDAKYEKHFANDRLLITGAEMSSTDKKFAFDDLGFIGPALGQNDLFSVRQQDLAAYATYQFKLGGFGFLPGLRFEQNSIDWSSRLAMRTGENTYDRILPSLFITRKLGDNGKLRASYSEGTTSLSVDQLNPAFRYQSTNYAVQGNPLLKPADRRTFEFGYDYDKNGFSLVSTLFYRDTTNQIVNYSRRGAGELLISNYLNLGETLAYGLGATFKGKLSPKFNYTVNFEVSSNSFTNPFLSSGQSEDDQIGYNGKFILEYKPNSVDQFSTTTTFQSDVFRLNSFQSGFWTTNFQFSHKFPNKLSLIINVIDVGVSPQRVSRSSGVGFEGLSRYGEGTRALKIGLTKRF